MVILRIWHRFDFKNSVDELQARLLVLDDEFLDVGPDTVESNEHRVEIPKEQSHVTRPRTRSCCSKT